MSTKSERPLSPHLMIYKPMLTMMMSMMHRITGAALYFASVVLVILLAAVAAGPQYFSFVYWLMTTWLGMLVMFAITWALVHHTLGGIKHFVWDTSRAFEVETLEILAWVALLLPPVIAFMIWAIGYYVSL